VPDAEMNRAVAELKKHPSTLYQAFETALSTIEGLVDPAEQVRWAQEGVRVARQTARSWESAAEYFRASPRLIQALSYPQFQRWVDSGIELCKDSPTMAAAYFRASPGVMAHLAPRNIAGWATLGSGLSRGTWKSASLAARFFDSSPDLAAHLNFREMQQFVALIDALSRRSYDLAADCLHLGQRILPTITEREELISLATTVVDGSWREVRGCFEAAGRVPTSVSRPLRGRVFALTEEMARQGMTNVAMFMGEATQSLAKLPESEQEQVLTKAEELSGVTMDAVSAFLHTTPTVMQRISSTQFEHWYSAGHDLLKENVDGGVAYFRIESSRAENTLDLLSSTVELAKVSGLLTMYASALAGSEVELEAATELTHKNIGWVEVEQATTDGTRVYLPSSVDRHPTKPDNFSWLKVVTTHQVGHIEFGSFEFEFERAATRFEDLRPMLEKTSQAQATTAMARYFNLFTNRALAADVFSVVEDTRMDYCVLSRYKGLAPRYRQVQADALSGRPRPHELPLQQAMVEMMIQLSMQHSDTIPVPHEYAKEARQIAGTLRLVQSDAATVEDSAEASLRIYSLIASLPNEQVPPEEWDEEDLSQSEYEEPNTEQVMTQFSLGSDGTGEEGEEYESPDDVDYRGDFKPEMVQLLAMMRGQGADDLEDSDMESMTQESLEELLRDSVEFDAGDEANLSTVANNLMKEAGTNLQPKGEGAGHSDIPHQDEEGGSLEPVEPRSYVYDEWDFRANDYRPRWCVVQEKQIMSGDTRFFQETLQSHSGLMEQIRRQFEAIRPEMYRRVKHLSEGEDVDFDAALDAMIDIRGRRTPDDRIYWRRNKAERDVAVVFLLDMSASTAEAVEEAKREGGDWDVPSDPVAYTMWLRARRGESQKRQYKRIIDVEKESMVLLMTALDAIGDRYGVYGFSGFGRENVEFYVIKELEESMSDHVRRRLDKVSPLHATRMGPAIRHATTKLEELDAKTKFLFVVSDGRPQDRGYSREGVEKEYAVQDTRMALLEARDKDITPFCLTVDRQGHDYMRTMAGDMGYEVVPDVMDLPRRLPALYRSLTV